MRVLWLLLLRVLSTLALDNGLALTPPMGWLTWLSFLCNVDCDSNPKGCLSEGLIRRTADRIVSDGYLAAGYEYVIIDDCWLEKTRGPDGRMVPDRKRFKSGMKAIADYLHSRNLKFGMYQDIGNQTCQRYPGVAGHEQVDIDSFVEWEIDYLKLDGCFMDPKIMDTSYPAFGKLLNATGRPILYSCSWPAYQEPNKMQSNYTAIAESCNIWRNWDDIEATWDSITKIMDWFGDNQGRLVQHAGPGHWNDPDMLAVGIPSLTPNQAEAQMAVWAVMAAPLMISVDLDEVAPEYKRILLNRDVIAVNQDKLGIQGQRIFKMNNLEIWSRELVGKSYAVAFVNRNVNRTASEFSFRDMALPIGRYEVKDLFLNVTGVLEPNEKFLVTIEKQGVRFYKVTPTNKEQFDEENELKTKYVDLNINNELNEKL